MEMENTKNHEASGSPGRTGKPLHSFIGDLLTQLATALELHLTPDRLALYCRGLDDIGEVQLIYAFDQALHNLGAFFPTIEQLHVWAAEWRTVELHEESRRILSRPDKPIDWNRDADSEEWRRLGRNAGVTAGEIAQWLEGGKQAQWEHIARITQTRGYQEAAGRAGVPGYRNFAEQAAASAIGASRVPQDPDERSVWARQTARKQGWIETPREPGEEG